MRFTQAERDWGFLEHIKIMIEIFDTEIRDARELEEEKYGMEYEMRKGNLRKTSKKTIRNRKKGSIE